MNLLCGIFLAIFSFFILNKNINGIVILNSVLMPIIILMLLVLGAKTLGKDYYNLTYTMQNGSWIISSILYASYNSITLISILIPIKRYIKTKKDIVKISAISSIIIIILALVIFGLLLSIDGNLSKIDLPSVYAASRMGLIYKYLYGAVILRSNFNYCNIFCIWLSKQCFKNEKKV